MKKIIGFFKEDWKFKLVMVIVAIAIGIGSYFNYKVENIELALELTMVTVSSIIIVGVSAAVYYRSMKKKAVDKLTVYVGVILSVLFDLLARLIF